MPGPLTSDEKSAVNSTLSTHTTGERTKWCRDLLGYLGQFKWAGNTADWASDSTENLAMNCWCAPIYIAYKTKRVSKKSVDDFSMLAFQYSELSALHASQRAAHEYLKADGAGGDEGVPGDLIFFYLDSLAGLYGSGSSESQKKYTDSVPLAKCPVHVAVNMGAGRCVSLWSTPNDYDKYQYCLLRDLVQAIERDRKANCNYTSIEPFWLTGAHTKKPCYITTAACQSLGLPDDCRELTVLRWFRDEVVSRTPAGRADVAAYYDTAPRVVAGIDRRPDAAAVYARLLADHIRPAVAAVERGEYGDAHARLRELVDDLLRQYAGAEEM